MSQSSAHRAVFTMAAVLALIVSFLGFRLFYMNLKAYPGRDIAPPMFRLVVLHAVMMSAWVLLLFVQSALILMRKHKWHMKIGWAGAIFAMATMAVGLMLAIASVRNAPPGFELWHLNARQFMAVPFLTILFYGAFVAIGVWQRKKPAVHRSMMVLATVAALTAAFDRIGWLTALHGNTLFGKVFGPFFWPIVLGIVLLASRSLLTRKFDRAFAIGLLVFMVFGYLDLVIARTHAWESFVGMLI